MKVKLFKLFLFLLFSLVLADSSRSASTSNSPLEIEAARGSGPGPFWFGTDNGGLSRFDGKTFQRLNTDDGLTNDFIVCLYEDRQESIWIGTVDDERIARNNLQAMLAQHPQIQVVGEADCVPKAIALIKNLKPEVVFLDVQLPQESGFELLNQLEEITFKVIFVTAYDEYAIRAFEVNALDYLLKPVEPKRLAQAIERLKALFALGSDELVAKTIKRGMETETKKLAYHDCLFLKMNNISRFIKVGAIKCIHAAGGYSEVWTSDGKKGLVFLSLQQWEERLPERYFIRIHRSTIINSEHVERVEEWFGYSYQVYLKGISEPFVMSRRQAAKLKGKLK